MVGGRFNDDCGAVPPKWSIAGCGFALDLPDRLPITEPPPPEALRLLREEIDPHGMRRLETHDGRQSALLALQELS